MNLKVVAGAATLRDVSFRPAIGEKGTFKKSVSAGLI